MSLDPIDQAALLRWRLALGSGAEDVDSVFGLSGLGTLPGLDNVGEADEVLDVVYGGSGPRKLNVPQWLGKLRDLFPRDTVAFLQKDAIERKGLTQLLFEPETLAYLERNVDLVTTLMSARGLVPDRAKEIARGIVREVVDELRKKLEAEVRTAIIGAVRRDSQSPLKVARNIDWQKTIRRNLKGWDKDKKRLVPETFHFWSNQRRRHEWDVVLCVDQSGSMAQSVVYSSVMAAIFASLDVLRTKLVVFDTEVVDLTPVLDDPVEVLFAAQLGGGTDINRAVAYCADRLIERPEKTIFLLITDLCEGGDRAQLVARLRALHESRVKTLVLLALTDGGKPYFDQELGAQIAGLGIRPFGCTPRKLVAVMERIMKNQDATDLLTEEG